MPKSWIRIKRKQETYSPLLEEHGDGGQHDATEHGL